MELNNMYINTYANNGSDKLWTEKKDAVTSGKLIKAVYASCVYAYIFCAS